MAELDQELIKKGKDEPRDGLRDQGVVSIGLAQKFETPLDAKGWAPDQTEQMGELVELLGSNVAEQVEAKQTSKSKTVTERRCRAEGKAIGGQVRTGADIVLLKNTIEGVTKESFEVGCTLGQSTPKIAMYLEKILPPTRKLDEHLKRFFDGQLASKLVETAKDNLDKAQQQQETAIETLPLETQEIYEAKGKLLREIEELNKVAKIAFWNDKTTAAMFNKDVLNRARKKKGGDAGGGE